MNEPGTRNPEGIPSGPGTDFGYFLIVLRTATEWARE